MSADAADAGADAAAERRLNHSIPVRTSYRGYNNPVQNEEILLKNIYKKNPNWRKPK